MASTTSNLSLGLGSGLMAYVDTLRGKAAEAKNEQTGGATGEASATARRGGHTAPVSHKTTLARQELDKQQQAIAKEFNAALAKAGTPLKGDVSFGIGSDGHLTISGSDTDKASIKAALKADKSNPSLASRIGTLAQRAATLETGVRQSAAISQAARYAGHATNVLALYNSLMQQQGSASAVFTLSDKGGALSYRGMVDSTA